MGSEGGTNVEYGLRENPKKTWRLTDSSEDNLVLDKFCKECGKGFTPGKLYSWTNNASQSDTEATVPNRRRRSKRRRTRYMTTPVTSSMSFVAANPSSSVSEVEQEQEEVAMSLIMLSRDMSPWGGLNSFAAESSDNNSLMQRNRVFIKNGKLEIDSESAAFEAKFLHSEPKSSSLKNKNSHKRGKFECTTCNKIFPSYQALGGHRASHKNINSNCFASRNESSENNIELEPDLSPNPTATENTGRESKNSSKGHECPICLKVFPSGQALGGHKRSHLASEPHSQTVVLQEAVPEIRNFLDLNS
ncbi:Zinc finger C2H2-type [Sesbania bispinosa]|nr:Zinc finger C2H2-type [Sesbania bispinosa]